MKDKLKSTEVEKLKSKSLSAGKTEPFNSSTLQPFNHTEKVYRKCLKQERDRERQWRKSKRCDKIRNVVHLVDFEEAESLENSPAWLSDVGKGVEDIVAACDGEGSKTPLDRGCESKRRDILRNARKRLKRAHPELLEVFNLIVKNGKNRKESIWALMMSKDTASGTQPKSGTGAI